MSNSSIQNPFGVNLAGSLLQDIGLNINTVTANLVGTSHTVSSYTPGTLVTETCLNDLTLAINAGYGTLGVNLDIATYANLIAIGSGVVPALGNSKPPTFTWIGPANTGDSSSEPAQEISWYPYTATSTTNTYPTSNPTPRQWSDLTTTTYNPNITQWGWIRLFALQAWNEFNWNGDPSASSVEYKDFLTSFSTCSGFAQNMNKNVNAMAASTTFLKNTYSNNNDLMTSDITGVNLATLAFGQDLLLTGKAIDLSKIDKFGLPSILLQTLNKYNALTPSVSYALLASGLSPNEIKPIADGTVSATLLQEQKIYGAFSIIIERDLKSILIALNCSTPGLVSLVDLLDPQKLFPSSYISLTVPVYNSGPGPTNAKTYYNIYSISGGVNSQLTNPQIINAIGTVGIRPISNVAPGIGTNYQVTAIGFGAYSRDAVPENISIAAGAFSFAMQQINNIKNVPIEKFAQIVLNLETLKGLDLVVGTDIPTNATLAETGLDQIAYGSGPYGTFTMSDFFGSMSGLPYQWTDIKNLILQLQTSTLTTIYNNIYTTISTATSDVSATVQSYINSANLEIAAIASAKPSIVSQLNKMWNLTGTHLTIEQRARDIALNPVPSPKSSKLGTFPYTVLGYVDLIQTYASKTQPHMEAQTIEAISDLTTMGGQSQIALMRSTRNQDKLNLAGIGLENNIPAEFNSLTNKILIGNGTVSIAREDQGVPAGSATFTTPADHNVLSDVQQIGHFVNNENTYCTPTTMAPSPVLGTIPENANFGQDLAGPNITQVPNAIVPIAGGFIPQGNCVNLNLGYPTVPGSLAGNPYQNLVAPQLSVPFISGIISSPTYSVSEAIEEVIRCNCDCWVE